ncbi:TIGR04222 domain-containing membrane protein [Erythrobacter sp. HKB08]|uniref:TIGR04222 domain-containing membrane protein n=1 Tax=Erythrobacter sp. HKB08 TaxID=2502843 RepID=UPI00100883AE|nr:TIGR04222 domain-containing membrane protein [Erythrobacter sp. HKB08]
MIDTGLSFFSGPAFLILFLVLMVVGWLSGPRLADMVRPEGRSTGAALGAEELAFLTGGARRVSETATAQLLARDAIVHEKKDRFAIRSAGGGQTALESRILSTPEPARWNDFLRAGTAEVAGITDRLRADGMLVGPDEITKLRMMQAAPYAFLVFLGAWRIAAGLGLGEPVGFLAILTIIALILMMVRFSRVDMRTKAGIEAVEAARVASSRLSRAPTQDEAGRAVALYGTAVLVGTPMVAVHELRQNAFGGDGGAFVGDGGGDSGDGGGGCGGGCGGCGG